MLKLKPLMLLLLLMPVSMSLYRLMRKLLVTSLKAKVPLLMTSMLKLKSRSLQMPKELMRQPLLLKRLMSKKMERLRILR